MLALTDNIRETARISGRSAYTVHKIAHEDQDQILMRRAEMSAQLGKSFDATIYQTQEVIRFFLQRLMDTEEPEARLMIISGPLFDLGKLVAIQTERRQVISDLPGEITRTESKDPEKQREADRRYLAGILRELKTKPSGLPVLEEPSE
uniref:Uncharacterized protein n=1 Tax=viral metagenome TaxID=1070528 RepID=A0A6H1ZJ75_9ZZZZ